MVAVVGTRPSLPCAEITRKGGRSPPDQNGPGSLSRREPDAPASLQTATRTIVVDPTVQLRALRTREVRRPDPAKPSAPHDDNRGGRVAACTMLRPVPGQPAVGHPRGTAVEYGCQQAWRSSRFAQAQRHPISVAGGSARSPHSFLGAGQALAEWRPLKRPPQQLTRVVGQLPRENDLLMWLVMTSRMASARLSNAICLIR